MYFAITASGAVGIMRRRLLNVRFVPALASRVDRNFATCRLAPLIVPRNVFFIDINRRALTLTSSFGRNCIKGHSADREFALPKRRGWTRKCLTTRLQHRGLHGRHEDELCHFAQLGGSSAGTFGCESRRCGCIGRVPDARWLASAAKLSLPAPGTNSQGIRTVTSKKQMAFPFPPIRNIAATRVPQNP